MWLPFSRYISAAPLSARLIASVPPDVNTTSFGSRTPSRRASFCLAPSTAPPASPPEGVVAAGRVTELLGEVREHRLDAPRVARRRRLRVHEDGEPERHGVGLLSRRST